MSFQSWRCIKINGQERIIDILLRLSNGEKVTKEKLVCDYGITVRTIQRDLSILKYQIERLRNDLTLYYNTDTKQYSLIQKGTLDHKEVLVLSKILLESRALTKKEITQTINKLLKKLDEASRHEVKQLIVNELLLYQPLSHNKDLVELIWTFSNFIRHSQVIEFHYKKQSGKIVHRQALPVSIFFSEYYFYILCYNPEYEKYLSYRLDRFIEFNEVNERVRIDYSDRLQDGELRKKIHFMYAGKEVTFRFQYWGVVESALDKLPDSKVIRIMPDSSALIEARAYDEGVKMWLLSQGSKVKLLSPQSFVEKMQQEVTRLHQLYFD